jgi:hypothetical protein
MTREEQLAELARRADEHVVLVERERRHREKQDSYRYLNYEIGDTQLVIRFFTLKMMTIPYSDVVDIEVASVFLQRIAEINLSNRVGMMCRIKRSRGWSRYVTITPRQPKVLLDALHRFRSWADPVADMSEARAALPAFLRTRED